MNLDLDLNYLFKSFPEAPHLELPKITPSGFSIGIIIVKTLDKTKLTFLSSI